MGSWDVCNRPTIGALNLKCFLKVKGAIPGGKGDESVVLWNRMVKWNDRLEKELPG
jgi:hypothetical protein